MVSLNSTTSFLLLFQSISMVESFAAIRSCITFGSHISPSHVVCLFSSSTHNNISPPKSTKSKKPIKNKQTSANVCPTARFVAAAALASGTKDDMNSSSFATRRLEQDVRYKQLEPRDRAFARLLVATVERRLGQIDSVLTQCIGKYPPKGKHSSIIQATLRIGVAQLLFLDTPPFANHDTVQVLRMNHRLSKSSYPVPDQMVRFVNGVLRKISRPLETPDEAHDNASGHGLYGHKLLENTSPYDNIAPWLIQQWKKDWGRSRTQLILKEMMPANYQDVTRIDVTTKFSLMSLMESKDTDSQIISSPKAMLENIRMDFGEDCRLLPCGTLRIGSSLSGDISNFPGYADGTWWIQDASSSLPALVLTQALAKSAVGDLNALHVVDMCSAPGGKASQLCSAGFGRVTAIEASERRSKRLIENINRLKFQDHCQVVVGEGQSYFPSKNDRINGILLDVPCSATGTGARRPDVLRRSPDLSELLRIQEVLANHCVDHILSAGGTLVYATCSILKQESEDQVAKLIARKSGCKVTTLPIHPSEVPGFEDAIDKNGWLRVLPGVLQGDLRSTDGFFVARLIKE